MTAAEFLPRTKYNSIADFYCEIDFRKEYCQLVETAIGWEKSGENRLAFVLGDSVSSKARGFCNSVTQVVRRRSRGESQDGHRMR